MPTYPLTDLVCRAAHPDGQRDVRFAERIHEEFIQRYPALCEPTGRILKTWEEVDYARGYFGVRCRKCKRITEYMIVERAARPAKKSPPRRLVTRNLPPDLIERIRAMSPSLALV